MTLRVILKIVPFGDEAGKYDIGYLDISNIGTEASGITTYIATLFSDQETELKNAYVQHNRADGAWVLTKKAIESLVI